MLALETVAKHINTAHNNLILKDKVHDTGFPNIVLLLIADKEILSLSLLDTITLKSNPLRLVRWLEVYSMDSLINQY